MAGTLIPSSFQLAVECMLYRMIQTKTSLGWKLMLRNPLQCVGEVSSGFSIQVAIVGYFASYRPLKLHLAFSYSIAPSIRSHWQLFTQTEAGGRQVLIQSKAPSMNRRRTCAITFTEPTTKKWVEDSSFFSEVTTTFTNSVSHCTMRLTWNYPKIMFFSAD